MMKVKWSILANSGCALMLAIPLTAASGPAASATKNVMPAVAMRNAWLPETLSGKITIVDPVKRLVVVKVPDGVTFDIVVTAKTRIKSGDHTVAIKDLMLDVNRNRLGHIYPRAPW